MLPAQASQNDARLPGLFDQLREARSTKDAAQVEQAIWQVWLVSGNFTADAHVHRGLQTLSDGRNEDALVDFTKATEVKADFAEAWNKRATVRFIAGDHRGSAKDIAQVLQLEPRHFGALSGLGMIQMHNGDWQNALETYELAFSIHPYLANVEMIIEDLRKRLKGRAS